MTTTKEQVRDHGSGTHRAGPDRPTLRFFYSPTSGPSRRVEAFLAQVLQRRQNHRTFELQRVNCDKHPEHVKRYAITQVPTLIVIEGRRVLGRSKAPADAARSRSCSSRGSTAEPERGPVEN